jgi:hypothetical protein
VTEGSCFVEWAASPDDDPTDPATWRATMPALGYTISEATVAPLEDAGVYLIELSTHDVAVAHGGFVDALAAGRRDGVGAARRTSGRVPGGRLRDRRVGAAGHRASLPAIY